LFLTSQREHHFCFLLTDAIILRKKKIGSREFAQAMQDGIRIAKQRGRDRQAKMQRGQLRPRQRYEREIDNRYGGQLVNNDDGDVAEDSDEEESHTDSTTHEIESLFYGVY
jgi:hypothetical protein